MSLGLAPIEGWLREDGNEVEYVGARILSPGKRRWASDPARPANLFPTTSLRHLQHFRRRVARGDNQGHPLFEQFAVGCQRNSDGIVVV